MPKEFNINRRPLTREEKLERAMIYYGYDNPDFRPVYLPKDDPDANTPQEELDAYHDALDKAIEEDNQEEIDRLAELHPYIPDVMDIEKTLELFDDITKSLIIDFSNQDIYDETITLKCLNCNHEETVDWDILSECWFPEDGPYPISYCPHCSKPKFVPLDIWNKKKKSN